MRNAEFYCETCDGIRGFEAPPCPDGHGGDCPEFACVDCGDALLFAPVTVADVRPAKAQPPRAA